MFSVTYSRGQMLPGCIKTVNLGKSTDGVEVLSNTTHVLDGGFGSRTATVKLYQEVVCTRSTHCSCDSEWREYFLSRTATVKRYRNLLNQSISVKVLLV